MLIFRYCWTNFRKKRLKYRQNRRRAKRGEKFLGLFGHFMILLDKNQQYCWPKSRSFLLLDRFFKNLINPVSKNVRFLTYFFDFRRFLRTTYCTNIFLQVLRIVLSTRCIKIYVLRTCTMYSSLPPHLLYYSLLISL